MLWLGRALLATRGRDHWRAGSAGAAGNAGWKSRLPDGAGVWTCHERGLHGPAVQAGVGVGRRAARGARSERAERAEAGLDLPCSEPSFESLFVRRERLDTRVHTALHGSLRHTHIARATA